MSEKVQTGSAGRTTYTSNDTNSEQNRAEGTAYYSNRLWKLVGGVTSGIIFSKYFSGCARRCEVGFCYYLELAELVKQTTLIIVSKNCKYCFSKFVKQLNNFFEPFNKVHKGPLQLSKTACGDWLREAICTDTYSHTLWPTSHVLITQKSLGGAHPHLQVISDNVEWL